MSKRQCSCCLCIFFMRLVVMVQKIRMLFRRGFILEIPGFFMHHDRKLVFILYIYLHHDIAEILLKLVLSINQSINQCIIFTGK